MVVCGGFKTKALAEDKVGIQPSSKDRKKSIVFQLKPLFTGSIV